MEATPLPPLPPRLTAYDLNLHLAAGRQVMVTTCTRATLYSRRHAGWFAERGGALHVRHGKGWNTLSLPGERGTLLVSIKVIR